MCPNVASRAQGDFKSSTEDNSWRMEHRALWKQLILPKAITRSMSCPKPEVTGKGVYARQREFI